MSGIRNKFASLSVVLLILVVLIPSIFAAVTSITLNSPANNSVINSNTTLLNLTATAAGNLSNVTFFFKNGTSEGILTVVTNDTSPTRYSNATFNLTTAGIANGVYNITAAASNTSTLYVLNSTASTNLIISNTFFNFSSRTYHINGSVLNVTNVTMEIISVAGGPPTVINRTTTNSISTTSTGPAWGNITGIPSVSGTVFYKPTILYNDTNGSAQFIGPSLPFLPAEVFSSLGTIDFYLRDAGTINITVQNSTNHSVAFKYQVKDTKLGYPIAEEFGPDVTQATVRVPKDRNYSISIYPSNSIPQTFHWTNFSSQESYNIGGSPIASYNATSRTLHKAFNASMGFVKVSGYLTNITGASSVNSSSLVNLTVIPYLLEGGDTIFTGSDAFVPFNLSGIKTPATLDNYTNSTGLFEITLIGAPDPVDWMLFITATDGSKHYGGYRNVTVNMTNITAGDPNSFNFTKTYVLRGTNSSIAVKNMGASFADKNISTALQSFSLTNSTSGATITQKSAHIEVTLDYASYGSKKFNMVTFLDGTGDATFSMPLINATGVEEINVYMNEFAPKRTSISSSRLNSTGNNSIPMKVFDSADIEGKISKSNINVALYKSNSTCDVPVPPAGSAPNGCVIADSKTVDPSSSDQFDPFASVLGGGKISFRMGTSTIKVHYVNVDMMASGPPDALFDDNANQSSSSSSSLSQAWRFGSGGPTIYDYVLVAFPYSESAGGLNDTQVVNVSVGLFYDEDDFTTPIWNTTVNGTNATLLAGNFSHYDAKKDEWQTLMTGTLCQSAVASTGINATYPCYINTTANEIWLRLPHFSGTAAELSGTIVPASSSSSSSSSDDTTSASEKAAEQAHTFTTVEAGETNSMSITKDDLALTEIEFIAEKDLSGVKITVTKVDDNPVSNDVDGKAFRYLDIDVENLDDDDIEEATIKFEVDKDWIEDNNIDKSTIALYRYSGGKWNALETRLVDDSGPEVQYEAETPGFSYFAIAGKEVEKEEAVQTNQTQAVTPVDQEEGGKGWIWAVVGIVALLAALSAAYYFTGDKFFGWLKNRNKGKPFKYEYKPGRK